MNPILVFLIPPAAGAFIGYSTNVAAIKMLFRPLKEKRVFGVRLPFTPGILPKQRYRLAQSIGGMVERELLTPEILRQRLAREDVRESIKNAVSLFTEKLLEKTPNELFEGNENFLSEKITEAAKKMYPSFSSALLDFMRRREIREELESRGRVFLRNIFLQLNTLQRLFLSAGQYDVTLQEKMPEIINDLIANTEALLNDNKIKNTLINVVNNAVSGAVNGQGKKISKLINLSEDGKKKLDDFLFDKLMSAADGQIENMLASINVKALVSDRIDSLDMLRVERIVLDVMSDQFKWVEIFGGVLGFLIGVFQSLFVLFIR